jgi:hypothetical protein
MLQYSGSHERPRKNKETVLLSFEKKKGMKDKKNISLHP